MDTEKEFVDDEGLCDPLVGMATHMVIIMELSQKVQGQYKAAVTQAGTPLSSSARTKTERGRARHQYYPPLDLD